MAGQPVKDPNGEKRKSRTFTVTDTEFRRLHEHLAIIRGTPFASIPEPSRRLSLGFQVTGPVEAIERPTTKQIGIPGPGYTPEEASEW